MTKLLELVFSMSVVFTYLLIIHFVNIPVHNGLEISLFLHHSLRNTGLASNSESKLVS